MRLSNKLTVSILTFLLLFMAPVASIVNAASFEFTVTYKTAFDKMIKAAKEATAGTLEKQYVDLQALQKQDVDWDKKINDLHYSNDEAVLLTRSKLKEIDAAKIKKLQEEVQRTKDKYQPLVAVYDSLKQQLALAKSLKNTTLAAMLKPQVETAKVAVQLARQNIRDKEAALKAAKAATAQTVKQIRETLAGIDTTKVKVKAAKSTISSTKKQFTTEVTILKQVVKKGDATATISSFTRLLSLQRQINEQKGKVFAFEQQITTIITKANSQIPSK
ncbi:MAG: hypothetical protein ACE3L7_27980 [Candidatus Pristimantibacillus sp.]